MGMGAVEGAGLSLIRYTFYMSRFFSHPLCAERKSSKSHEGNGLVLVTIPRKMLGISCRRYKIYNITTWRSAQQKQTVKTGYKLSVWVYIVVHIITHQR